MQKAKLKEEEILKQGKLFQEIASEKITPEIAKKTLEGLKEFREKHWDDSLPRDEAYKKYLKLFESFFHPPP